eukprot:7379438-Prymnesium_polylepis.3
MTHGGLGEGICMCAGHANGRERSSSRALRVAGQVTPAHAKAVELLPRALCPAPPRRHGHPWGALRPVMRCCR